MWATFIASLRTLPGFLDSLTTTSETASGTELSRMLMGFLGSPITRRVLMGGFIGLLLIRRAGVAYLTMSSVVVTRSTAALLILMVGVAYPTLSCEARRRSGHSSARCGGECTVYRCAD